MSHLTDEEIEALNASELSRATVFAIRDVSNGFFSVARHYGGAKFNGEHYTYIAESDELIRDDVLAWIAKRRKADKMQKRSQAKLDRPTQKLLGEVQP